MKASDFIKRRLKEWLIRTGDLHEGDVLVEELCFLNKRNRADLVCANGRLSAFEVKSNLDTLARWPDQMQAYLRVFDEVWLCVHSKHVERALASTAAVVGIMVVDDFGGLAVIRMATLNKKLVPFHLTELLWRSELDELCQSHGIPVRRAEGIKAVRERISESISVDSIREHLLISLKSRYSDQAVYSSSSSKKSSLSTSTGNPTASRNSSIAQMC